MKIRVILMLTGFLGNSCLTDERESEVLTPVNEISFRTSEKVILRNEGETRNIKLLINNKRFYSSFTDIVAGSIRRSMATPQFDQFMKGYPFTALDTALCIWYNTSKVTVHNTPLSQNYWLHHPLLFLNSVGNGICDDVANINESIWSFLQYPSQTWYLNGHVVSEVFLNSQWNMLDSDIGIYFINDSILSVTDLLDDPAYFADTDIQKQIIIKTKDWQAEHWEHLVSIFENGEGAIDTSVPEIDLSAYDYSIPVPHSGEVIFGKNLTPSPISFESDYPNYYNLIIKSSRIDSLSLNLFLYPIYMKGTGQIFINDTAYRIEECDRDFFLNLYNTANHWHATQKMVIRNAENFEVVYMINGFIFDLVGNDRSKEREGHKLRVLSESNHGIMLAKEGIN